MLVLAVISALTGAALGLRYRALLLVPASGFAAAAALSASFDSSSRLQQAFATFLAVAALQIGYLAGVALRSHLPKRRRAVENAPFEILGLSDDAKDRLDARQFCR